jgi:sugar lactone lactonase YvrE
MRIEEITQTRSILGGSPQWDVDTNRLLWVASLGRKIFRAAPDGSDLLEIDLPANVGSIALCRDGGLVGAFKTGLHFVDLDTGALTPIRNPEPELSENTLNDGKVDAAGRFWFGSMNINEAEPSGALYRLDKDLSITKVLGKITISNGPCWSANGKQFYFADSTTRQITVYDFDPVAGTLDRPRSFFGSPFDLPSTVDGATVDAEGFLWSAQVYSGRIVRVAPDGSVDRIIKMPTPAVTSVMFGGPDLNILFLTSMARPLKRNSSHQPDTSAGALFAVRGLGIRGLPEPKFAGGPSSERSRQ